MSNLLGLLAFAAYVVVIIGVAAGVTWVVVKLTPPKSSGQSSGPTRS